MARVVVVVLIERAIGVVAEMLGAVPVGNSAFQAKSRIAQRDGPFVSEVHGVEPLATQYGIVAIAEVAHADIAQLLLHHRSDQRIAGGYRAGQAAPALHPRD